MKILMLGSHNNLEWKDVIYKDNYFRSTDERQSYDITAIYAVKDDDRNKTVICSACGQAIPNKPSAIRAHRNMVNKSNKCFDCNYLKRTNETILSQKYVLNDDGTYSESTKRTVKLNCYRGYRTRDINSEDARHNCRYAACEKAKFKPIEDFWTKYPDAFDEFITTDRIIDIGYSSMFKYSDCITFSLKGKIHLTARTNSQGVCYSFALDYRRNTYTLRYSKKYDKVWVERYNSFQDLSSIGMSQDAQTTILKKLRALYE
jgi:hypothetical protein